MGGGVDTDPKFLNDGIFGFESGGTMYSSLGIAWAHYPHPYLTIAHVKAKYLFKPLLTYQACIISSALDPCLSPHARQL